MDAVCVTEQQSLQQQCYLQRQPVRSGAYSFFFSYERNQMENYIKSLFLPRTGTSYEWLLAELLDYGRLPMMVKWIVTTAEKESKQKINSYSHIHCHTYDHYYVVISHGYTCWSVFRAHDGFGPDVLMLFSSNLTINLIHLSEQKAAPTLLLDTNPLMNPGVAQHNCWTDEFFNFILSSSATCMCNE